MAQADIIHGDRRLDRRYQVEIPMRFSYMRKGVTCLGSGKVADLSRGGVRFDTDSPPPNGAEIELRLAWPFLLQNVCPLELLMWGEVLHTNERGTVVQATRYEFRTCGARSFNQANAAGASGRYSIMA